jgi:hypothetical protein
MFSLARLVHEELNFFGDVLDKRPSEMSRSAKDPLILVLDGDLPLRSKVVSLLASALPAQQVWAIANIARLVAQGVECEDLVAQLPRLLWSKSTKVELAAANTAHALLCRFPETYTPIFIRPILERAAAVPAVEYVDCIQEMASSVDAGVVKQTIIPLLDRLFQQNVGHRHAACRILQSLPVDRLPLNPETFERYLAADVLISEHLSDLALKFAPKFGETWIAVDLPKQLLRLEPSLGIIKFFVDFLNRIKIPELGSILVAAFEHAQTDHAIGLVLLRRMPIILQSKFTELHSRLLPLISVLAASSVDATKIELINVCAEVPWVLRANENMLYRVFNALSADKSVAVRKAFLTAITDLFDKVPTPSLRNVVMQVYQQMLNDPDMGVLELMVNEYMLVKFAQMRSPSQMCLVLDLAEKFKNRWRFFSKILATIEQFPTDEILAIITRLLVMVKEAVTTNPQSLGRQVVSFYAFVVRSRFEGIKIGDFLIYLYTTYAKSDNYRERILYIQLAQGLIPEFSQKEFIDRVWPSILEYATETVSLVRVKVLQFVLTVRKEFESIRAAGLTNNITELLENYWQDPDPEVQAMLAQFLTIARKPKSAGVSCETLPKIDTAAPQTNCAVQPAMRLVSRRARRLTIPINRSTTYVPGRITVHRSASGDIFRSNRK